MASDATLQEVIEPEALSDRIQLLQQQIEAWEAITCRLL